MAMRNVLGAMAWLPEVMGPGRESHLMRSSSVVRQIVYAKANIRYELFDAPATSTDVLRLSFRPRSIMEDGKPLDSFEAVPLSAGDFVVTIHRSGVRRIDIRGDDPQLFLSARGADTTEAILQALEITPDVTDPKPRKP